MHLRSWMHSMAASLKHKARRPIPLRKRRASLQKHPNLFDVLLNDIYVWETLENEHKTLAIDILARLLAQAATHNLNPKENHECPDQRKAYPYTPSCTF